MNGTRILSLDEVVAVLCDLEQRAKRSINAWQNRTIFRLSCGCGLRVKEIAGLNLADVVTLGDRPAITVRKEITKGRDGKRKSRTVPLWWDHRTHADIQSWKEQRLEMGAAPDDPFVCGLARGYRGQRLTTAAIARRWKNALRSLSPERVDQLSIHSGRHSFCSHALRVGRSLVEVRDAVGHANISMTSTYLHTIDRPGIPDLFEGLDGNNTRRNEEGKPL